MLYKVVMNGTALGQDVKNLLYYRLGIGIDVSGLTTGGTQELAESIRDSVWPTFKTLLPGAYELQDIDVYAYHDTTFELFYQNPFTLAIQELGERSEELNGPAPCAIIRFDLEPTALIPNGPKPPKRGYIAYGPMGDDLITEGGYIDRGGGLGAQWDALTAALSTNVVHVLLPAVFFPVRVHHDVVLGMLKITSFADVKQATVRTVASFRRSRQPEL